MTLTAFKNARLLDPATGRDEIGTLVVENGKIQALGADAAVPKGVSIIDCHGLCLAPGLVDMRVAVGEPGFEQRETIQSASRAAAAGGITAFAILPNTHPVIDDIAAILLITFFYSTKLDPIGLVIAVVGAAGLATLLTVPGDPFLPRPRFLLERLAFGIVVWVGMLHAGAHPALAGAILGLLLPMDLVRSVERRLHPWVAFGIMPLYAFANAGVRLEGLGARSGPIVPLLAGVIIALVVGKPVGITLSTILCVKLRWCTLPDGVDVKHILVIGCIAGMGFTMSIFICHLAFSGDLLATSKLAVLIASALAAVAGLVAGRRLLAPPT